MSTKIKTVIVVVIALVAIAGYNYVINMDPSQLAARGVGKDPHAHDQEQDNEGEEHEAQQARDTDPTEPIGPEDAPVQITVVWTMRSLMATEYRPLLQDMATKDYPGLVHVEFVEASNRERLQELGITDITQGIAINGKSVIELPGTAFGFTTFQGSPGLGDWDPRELAMAIEQELRNQGIEFESKVPPAPEPTPPPPLPDHEGHQH